MKQYLKQRLVWIRERILAGVGFWGSIFGLSILLQSCNNQGEKGGVNKLNNTFSFGITIYGGHDDPQFSCFISSNEREFDTLYITRRFKSGNMLNSIKLKNDTTLLEKKFISKVQVKQCYQKIENITMLPITHTKSSTEKDGVIFNFYFSNDAGSISRSFSNTDFLLVNKDFKCLVQLLEVQKNDLR